MELVFVTPRVGSVFVNHLSYQEVVLNVLMVPTAYKKVACLDVKVSIEQYLLLNILVSRIVTLIAFCFKKVQNNVKKKRIISSFN